MGSEMCIRDSPYIGQSAASTSVHFPNTLFAYPNKQVCYAGDCGLTEWPLRHNNQSLEAKRGLDGPVRHNNQSLEAKRGLDDPKMTGLPVLC